ncbi:hypothetical protein B7494_g3286 [Chlorociboria aeruginascens]|nr:hypothetical protein B7494_g3286 [Chlorociboria aeruginascens]
MIAIGDISMRGFRCCPIHISKSSLAMAATPSLLDDTPSLVTGTEWDTSGRITDAEWGHFTIGGRFRSPSSFQSPSSSSSPQPAQPPRPASPPLDFSDPTSLVTFMVGPDGGAQNFLIHKSIVCQVSPPLKAAFNSQFIEGQTQTYRLDDVKPKVFQLLMQWFYSRKITFEMHNDYGGLGTHSDNHVSPDICHSDRETTIDLWVLADRIILRASPYYGP